MERQRAEWSLDIGVIGMDYILGVCPSQRASREMSAKLEPPWCIFRRLLYTRSD